MSKLFNLLSSCAENFTFQWRFYDLRNVGRLEATHLFGKCLA